MANSGNFPCRSRKEGENGSKGGKRDGKDGGRPGSSSGHARDSPGGAGQAAARQRGSRESLTDSAQFDEEQGGIKTKIFHALGLNS
jgi:hypothetical protein